MEEADRTEESADDMTAAETAPSPKNDMTLGVRNCEEDEHFKTRTHTPREHILKQVTHVISPLYL